MKISQKISFDNHMGQKETIVSKINRNRKGTIFLPESFLPIDPQYASNILGGLVNDGILVRVSQGIYLKPKMTRFGPVMPSMYEIAEKIAKRDHAKILPYGPAAENYLGFSTQMPMNAVYLTTGASRKIQIGNRSLTFKVRTPENFEYKGTTMPILVLALKSIGKSNMTQDTLSIVYHVLKENPEEKTWKEDIKLAPNWIRKVIVSTKKQISDEMD